MKKLQQISVRLRSKICYAKRRQQRLSHQVALPSHSDPREHDPTQHAEEAGSGDEPAPRANAWKPDAGSVEADEVLVPSGDLAAQIVH